MALMTVPHRAMLIDGTGRSLVEHAVVARQLAHDEGVIPDEMLAGGSICCGLPMRGSS